VVVVVVVALALREPLALATTGVLGVLVQPTQSQDRQ
jgi:hypothetical protein